MHSGNDPRQEIAPIPMTIDPDVRARAERIRLVIFDIDGVLTDGRLYFDEQGREYKSFHSRDGHGIKLLRQTGVETAVISGRAAASVTRRMDGLGVRLVYQGVENKLAALASITRETALSLDQIAHVGDDLPDLPVMRRVGLAVAVADAHFSVTPHAHWHTRHPGGAGAAREVCDLIMVVQGTLSKVIRDYY